MSKQKQTAVVVCPGRGTYNKPELGYLSRLHHDKSEIISVIDEQRRQQGQVTVSELDAMDKYSMAKHTAGENASSLIYACAACDFADIDTDKYDIVAVTGNSMGWYIALALAQALKAEHAATLINTMGSMMKGGVIGGQMIYPVTDENWQADETRSGAVTALLAEAASMNDDTRLYVSIMLGGYVVLGGNDKGLDLANERLPRIDDTYPMRLYNHAAFHTPLLDEIAVRAQQQLSVDMFDAPALPLIDGEGSIWQPHSADVHALRQYTLGTQVYAPYDFSKAIEVALKEFAPDKIIVTGPGTTLGGAIGQCLVQHHWQGIGCKADFIERQKADPYLLAMGLDAQRSMVTRS